MTLIAHGHTSQFMKWHNLAIIAFKHVICVANVSKIAGIPNNYQFYLRNLLKLCYNIFHKLLISSKFLETFMEILEWSELQK